VLMLGLGFNRRELREAPWTIAQWLDAATVSR
jgi:hypothetical protein